MNNLKYLIRKYPDIDWQCHEDNYRGTLGNHFIAFIISEPINHWILRGGIDSKVEDLRSKQ